MAVKIQTSIGTSEYEIAVIIKESFTNMFAK